MVSTACICEQLSDLVGKSRPMAQALAFADQLSAANEFDASSAITLLPRDSDQPLGIASPPPHDWHNDIPPLAMTPAIVLSQEGRFDDASAHVERAGPHAAQANSTLNLAQLKGVWAII